MKRCRSARKPTGNECPVATKSNRRPSLPPASAKRPKPIYYAEVFVLTQILCQLLLLSSAIGQARILVRSAVFGASILLIFARARKQSNSHPAAALAQLIIVIVSVEFFSPTTNSIGSGLMSVCMYVAILGPLFWVPGTRPTYDTFQRVLLFIWLFSFASATIGVLQVKYPGSFQPALSTAIQAQGQEYLSSLYITASDGQQVFRPMGLTDQPGGAGIGAYNSCLLGFGFLLTFRRTLSKFFCCLSILIGVACLNLCQVRSFLVGFFLCVVVLIGIMVSRGQGKRAAITITTIVLVVTVGLAIALALSPVSVSERLATLTEASPVEVYRDNRGDFLRDTFDNLLPEYPVGAGLGRWGMPYVYFGDKTNQSSETIYAEIQWTGWVLDGGILLTAAYAAALLLAISHAWKLAKRTGVSSLTIWAAVMFAVNVSFLALTFNSPVFNSELGVQFWLLNALLAAASAHSGTPPRSQVWHQS